MKFRFFGWFFCYLIFCSSCSKNAEIQLFKSIDSSNSGLKFNNRLIDSDSLNIIDYLYYYNGGGVGIGDLNNDNLLDIVFTANQSSDKIYLNQGGLKFKDVTIVSGIDTSSSWSSGVNIIDINADGWNDIYICRVGDFIHLQDHNRLYINQKDGTFKEESKQYHLDFSGFSTQAAFFDMDQDGDLDCYLLNHSVKSSEQFVTSQIRFSRDSLSGDKFLRNDKGIFTDVTESFGVYSSTIGFGLGVTVGDFNNDSWLDLYIGNDFHEQDYIYLNNKGLSFIEVSNSALGHSSNFTMGVACDDLDDDGKLDIVTLDMQAEDEQVYKASGGWENLQIYNYKHSFGYHFQSPRNTIQMNISDSSQIKFYEKAGFEGFSATDWSWSALLADFNGDLKKDIYVTNGIYKRPNDMDYVDYMSENISLQKTDSELIDNLPNGMVPNYLFLAKNGRFYQEKVNFAASISTGASYADLDNDGDYDIVVNNINSDAFLLENTTNPSEFVHINLKNETSNNPSSSGAKIRIVLHDKREINTHFHFNTGFQSSSNAALSYSINHLQIKEIKIQWPDGNETIHYDFPSKEIFISKNSESKAFYTFDHSKDFEILETLEKHEENAYNDQNRESLIPYLLSTNSPKIIKGKSIVSITAAKNSKMIFRSTEDLKKELFSIENLKADVNDAAIADFNGDGLEDIYLGYGGNEVSLKDNILADDIYMQNKLGAFIKSKIPEIDRNTGSVSCADIDKDGDVDLFIGVQGKAGQYGQNEASYFLLNNGTGQFAVQESEINELVFDSEMQDVNGDGNLDVIVVGHWFPVTILIQKDGAKFAKLELENSTGLWFSVFIDDVDENGELDLICGNFGLNHRFSDDSKLSLYAYDYDENRQIDPLISLHFKGQEYPYANFSMMSKQLPLIKKRFSTHAQYSKTLFKDLLPENSQQKAKKKSIQTLHTSCFFQSDSKWNRHELPDICQLAPIWAIEKFENGKYLLGGNFYQVDPNLGRQDASKLSLLEYKNDAFKAKFASPLIDGEIRDIKKMSEYIMVSRNSASTVILKEKGKGE